MYLNLRPLYLILIFLALSTDTLFVQMGWATDKYVISLMVMLSLLFYKHFSSFMKKWYLVVGLYFFILMMESYYYYNTPLKYMHVFRKVMVFYVIFTIYGFYKKYDKIHVGQIAWIIIISTLINIILINRHALSASAFASNNRGLAAESVYMLVVPLIYAFNKYFTTRNLIQMYLFFISFGLILFLQHRTVWVVAFLALAINFFFLRKANIRIEFVSLVPMAVFVFLISMAASIYFLSNQKVMDRIEESIEQLSNPLGNDKDDEESTSEWRYRQTMAYWPFIEENMIIGMRFRGFELPMQMYNEDANKIFFADNTGHHFHSLYVDRLFYGGIVGVLLLVIPVMIQLYYFFLSPNVRNITVQQLTVGVYAATGLVFGLSYDWPTYFYGLLGFALCHMEKAAEPQNKENKATDNLKN